MSDNVIDHKLVLREVKREERSGRGMYWRLRNSGYTSSLLRAGLYPPTPGGAPKEANYVEVPAAHTLALEAGRLMAEAEAMLAKIHAPDGDIDDRLVLDEERDAWTARFDIERIKHAVFAE